MSSTFIDAKATDKKEKMEKQEVSLTLYFGVFFDSTESKGKGRELSRLYRKGYQKESERSFSISSTVVEPEFIYIEKDGVVQQDFKDMRELNGNAGKATEMVISAILDIISGFAQSYKLKLQFDIYGFDSGMIAAYALGYIIDSSKNGFTQECQYWIFDEISDVYIKALRSLVYPKVINHFTIAETVAAVRRQKEIQQSVKGVDAQESDGYMIKASVLKTEGLQTELEQHGFTKQDIDAFMDNTQTALDGLGMVDVFGIGSVADALNVIISVGRGKWGDAALSLLAIIPIIGNYATGAKVAKRAKSATQIVKNGEKGTNNVIDAADRFRKSNKSESAQIAYLDELREYKIAQLDEIGALKEGTTGTTITNSIGRVSGGGGDYGRWSGKTSGTGRKIASDKDVSIFSSLDEGYDKVEAIEETGKILPLQKVGDSDHGQEHAIEIINKWLKFKWRGSE